MFEFKTHFVLSVIPQYWKKDACYILEKSHKNEMTQSYIETPCFKCFIFENHFILLCFRAKLKCKIHIPMCQKLFNTQGSLRETIS